MLSMNIMSICSSLVLKWLCYVIIAAAMISCSSYAPIEKLDLTVPGHTQRELDQHVIDTTVFTNEYIDSVVVPEYMLAYSAAAEHLERLRAEKSDLAHPEDYMVGFGETDKSIVVAFLARLRQNPSDEVARALRRGDTIWQSFYNYGNAPSILITVSKSDYSILCSAEWFPDCFPNNP